METFRPWAHTSMRGLAALVLVVAACLATPRPVGATTTGGGVLTATVTLPTFPCYIGGCLGSATGTAGLSLNGLGTATIGGVPVPYAAVWLPTKSSLNVEFTYQDTCELNQPSTTPPLSGNGDGTFTLSGGSLALGGSLLSTATLSGGFHFTRVANVVLVALDNLSITPASGTPVLAVNLSAAITGQSASGFVWTNGPGTCAVPGGQVSNQTADVDGVVLQAA